MFRKTPLTIATALAVTLGSQASAFASDTAHNVRDHRKVVEKTVRDHRSLRKNEVVKVSRKDCRLGYENLRRIGYKHIVMFNCSGAKYKYIAHKDAAIWQASMHAYSGTMQLRYMGPVPTH